MKRQRNSKMVTLGVAWLLGAGACASAAEPGPGAVDAAGLADAGIDPVDAAVEGDAGPDVLDAGFEVPDAGPPDSGCPPYSHPGTSGCETSLSWQEFPTGPPARDHHVTFLKASGDSATLYVSGGLDEPARRVRGDLWYAPIGLDGAITTWGQGPNPPIVQMGAGVTVHGDRAYVVSGKTLAAGGTVIETAAVYSLGFRADGGPDTWRAERALPGGRFHGSAESVDRFIFAIGGLAHQPGLGSPEVWRAEVMEDGTLSEWSEVSPLPEGRSHHSSFVHDHRLYVLGGLDGSGVGFPSQTYPDYLWADIDADGNLTPWTRVALPFGVSTQSATVWDDRVVLFGGFGGDDFDVLDTVRMAPIEDGLLGDFQDLAPLPYARAHTHHTPSWKGWVYSFGGNTGSHLPVDRVVGGRLE